MSSADFVRRDVVDALSDDELREIVREGGPTALVDYASSLLDERAHDLELAINDRRSLGVCGFGPLTLVEHERVAAYERYQRDAEIEHDAQLAAGGRTICPRCGERSVTHRAVITLGHAGHPGAEFSDLASCEHCGHEAL